MRQGEEQIAELRSRGAGLGLRRLFLIAAGSVLLPVSAWGQGTTASLSGTVTDASGAVIPNAAIELVNENSHDTRTSKSNGSGLFNFSAVPVGDYDVTIKVSGFQTFQQTGIHLDPGDQKSLRGAADEGGRDGRGHG